MTTKAEGGLKDWLHGDRSRSAVVTPHVDGFRVTLNEDSYHVSSCSAEELSGAINEALRYADKGAVTALRREHERFTEKVRCAEHELVMQKRCLEQIEKRLREVGVRVLAGGKS